MNLRRTVLRDLNGTLHSIPNSEIRIVGNLTRGWSGINLNLIVGYGQNMEKITSIINTVGQGMARDDLFRPLITEPPKVSAIASFKESGIVVKVFGVTKPGLQWEVAGELRKRIMKIFGQEKNRH